MKTGLSGNASFWAVNAKGKVRILIKVLLVLACTALVVANWTTAGSTVTAAPIQQFLPIVMRLPAPFHRPSWGSPIVVDSISRLIWVVNPDTGTISAIDPESLVVSGEVPVGGEPWSLAVAPDGVELYVVDRAGGKLVIVNAKQLAVTATIEIGPEPGGVALSPSGRTIYVTLTAAATVLAISAQQQVVIAQTAVPPAPYAIAVTNDGDRDDADESIYITHYLGRPNLDSVEAADNSCAGEVTLLDAATFSVTKSIKLPADEHGGPNLLAGITLAGDLAWVPHVRSAPDLPNGLTTTVFASVTGIKPAATGAEELVELPLNDQEAFGSPVNNPAAAVPSVDGKLLYVVLAGSNLVEVIDVSDPAHPQLVKFLPVGQNPRGLALSVDGRLGYVMSYLSRTVTVLDLETLERIGDVSVTSETLDPLVLRGKVLFNTATDPRMARGGWMSCASCHPDGATDGITWRFPDGPRQTPALWNAGATLPWHWSAALDEAQDVEQTIQGIQLGLGLAPGADPPVLGAPLGGRSDDLDALAAYMQVDIHPPHVSPPTPDAAHGRELFAAAGCINCHGGPNWTISTMPGPAGAVDPDSNGMVDEVLRNVDTLNPLDVRGATGFDPPSLLGVGLTAPYFHDGSQQTLEALLASGHPNPNANGNNLSSQAIADMSAFLRSIGPDTPTFAVNP